MLVFQALEIVKTNLFQARDHGVFHQQAATFQFLLRLHHTFSCLVRPFQIEALTWWASATRVWHDGNVIQTPLKLMESFCSAVALNQSFRNVEVHCYRIVLTCQFVQTDKLHHGTAWNVQAEKMTLSQGGLNQCTAPNRSCLYYALCADLCNVS